MFAMSAVLDPEHGYRWLEKHPGNAEEKEAVRNKIFGNDFHFLLPPSFFLHQTYTYNTKGSLRLMIILPLSLFV